MPNSSPNTPQVGETEPGAGKVGQPQEHTRARSAVDATRRSDRIARSGPDAVEVRLPGLGDVKLSRPELAYVGGIVALSALGLLEWPIALVVAAGHVLAADRSSKTIADLGQAMERG